MLATPLKSVCLQSNFKCTYLRVKYLTYLKIKKFRFRIFLEKSKNLNLSSFLGVGGPPDRNSKIDDLHFLSLIFLDLWSKFQGPNSSNGENRAHFGPSCRIVLRRGYAFVTAKVTDQIQVPDHMRRRL